MKEIEIKDCFIVIDQIKDGDLFTTEYDTAAEAEAAARRDWNRMTKYDRNRRDFFGVLKSENPDPMAADHLDGNIVLILKQ